MASRKCVVFSKEYVNWIYIDLEPGLDYIKFDLDSVFNNPPFSGE